MFAAQNRQLFNRLKITSFFFFYKRILYQNPFAFLKQNIMKPIYRHLFFLIALFSFQPLLAQDSTSFNWQAQSIKTGDNQYEIIFTSPGADGWQLYAPNQVVSEVAMASVVFPDSAMKVAGAFKDSGSVNKIQSPIFEEEVNLY